MSSKLNPWGLYRTLSIRTRPLLASGAGQRIPFALSLRARRGLADDTSSRLPPPPPEGPSADSPLPPPDAPAGKYVRPPLERFAPTYLNAEALAQLEKVAAGEDLLSEDPGHKFGMPEPPGKNDTLHNRYPDVITQVTKLIMKDGKLSKAQRDMSLVLNFLRTSPAPKISPTRPLLPGAPPPSQLPLNPVLYLTLAIDSVAPLIRVRNMKGMAGGGQALEVPEPLAARQRRRIAVMWILDAVRRKKSKGSGRTQFAYRLAEEIIAVVEGRSTAWDRRQMVHKIGTTARANINHPAVLRKR